MDKVTFADRLRYAMDNAFSKGPSALIGWLGLLSALVILIASFVVWLLGMDPDTPFVQLLWMNLMRTMDSGTVAGDVGSWPYLLTMLLVTFGGIFVLSTLIGILTTGIEARLGDLRKGRSRVIEQNHTVILGWSEQIFPILSELIVANANQRHSCLVILAPNDKIEMEDEIRSKIGNSGRTRIVCRTGSPIEMADLAIASLHTARSIIILAPDDVNPDAEVIKALLAITNAPDRRAEPYHIVAELHEPKNFAVARMVGKEEAEIVLIGDLVARIIAQTCRQSGLSSVYTELLDFGGDEIYFKEEPSLVGKRFDESLQVYETSTVIGIAPRNGQPHLNPPPGTVIGAGDRLIVISADDDTIHLSGLAIAPVQTGAIVPPVPHIVAPEHALILGWNWRVPIIINELDRYAAPGSRVTVVANVADAEAILAEECAGLRNQTFTYHLGDTTDRTLLDALEIANYNHVITLSYSDTLEAQHADALTLMTLLHLRDIAQRQDKNFSIVSEMLDNRNRNLAEVTQADDFIVSSRLISLLLSQVSENKALNAVFADLFDADGSEVYLKPAERYVQPGSPVNFYTVVEAARQRSEIAIGYRKLGHSTDKASNYGVFVNPNKAVAVTFAPGDTIVVIAAE